jgi:hypothetical protein
MRKGKIDMNTYHLYLANARGQKLTGHWVYKAESFNEARRQFRADKPNFDYLNLEILAA